MNPKTGLRLVVAFSLLSVHAVAIQKMTPDDDLLTRLIDIPLISEFQWSPSGKQIAYVSNTSGTAQIYEYRLEERAARQITRRASAVTDPQWNPDGKSLLFLTDPGWQERYEVWLVNLNQEDGERRLLVDSGVVQRNARWSPDGSRLVLETNASGNFDLALWSPDDPVLRPLTHHQSNELQPQWSPDGRSVAFLREGGLWKVEANGGEPELLFRPGLGAALDSPRWSPDGGSLLFLTDLMGDWDLGRYSMTTRAFELIVTGPEEVSSPSWSPDAARIAFVSTQGFDKLVGIVDTRSREIQYIAGEGGVCASPQWSAAGDKLAFLMSSPTRAWDLWLYQDGQLRQLTDSMGGWKSTDFVSPREFFYNAREGFSIPSLLYVPRSFREAGRFPAILRIHGSFEGQWVRDFDPLVQYFALRGFVLLYPNPRGSGGYGRAYERLNDGDWGGGDFEDLCRARDSLAALDFVDPSRIAAWGGSYGGYLTYTLVSRAPEIFQAAVVRAGISDLRSQILERLGSPARFNSPVSGYPRELGGFPDQNPDFYRERSPLTWADRVRVPMLIMHGLRDSRVPPAQSTVWVRALKERVPVEYVEYPDEDHTLRRNKQTLFDQLRRVETFLQRYLLSSN